MSSDPSDMRYRNATPESGCQAVSAGSRAVGGPGGPDGPGGPGAASRRRRFLAATRTAAATAILAAATAAASAVPAGAQELGLPVGTPAPSAAVEDLDGNPMDLRDLIEPGKPALIEFWATWCEQCEALQPKLDALQKEYGDRMNIVAVAVAVSQSVRRVKRHLAQHDPGYPYVWDAQGAAVRAYRAPTTAVVVAVDASGAVAYTGVGPDQDLEAVVRRLLEAS